MACSWGPSPSMRQVPGSSPGPGGSAASTFFLHPPFLPPSGDSSFHTFPTQLAVRLGLNNTTGWVCHNPNSIKLYKIVQKLSPKHAASGVVQSPYPIYRHGKASLSERHPWHAAGDPRLARGRSRIGPGPAGTLCALFSPPSLPPSIGR